MAITIFPFLNNSKSLAMTNSITFIRVITAIWMMAHKGEKIPLTIHADIKTSSAPIIFVNKKAWRCPSILPTINW